MDQLELVARLAVAAAAGAVVGFERETRNHVAGMQTHLLVSLGAALFTVAGAYGFTPFVAPYNTPRLPGAAFRHQPGRFTACGRGCSRAGSG